MKLFMALFLLAIPTATPVTHSLKYFYTLSTGIPKFPDFSTVFIIDGVQIIHYDRSMARAAPIQDWMNKITEDIPTYWEQRTERLKQNEQIYNAVIETAKPCVNYTGGLYIVQAILACEWDDETDEVSGFNNFAYDGEDFIFFDMKTATWIALSPRAVVIQTKLDKNKELLTFMKYYFTQECHFWLKKFLNYGKSSLMRKDLPSVSLLQKTPSSPVTCHATGFYPDKADLFWRKDGVELHENVVRGKILPNHDGTFQTRVDLDLKEVKEEDWGRYSCVFHLSGVQEDVITPLDKRKILTNWRSDEGSPTAAVVAGLIILAACIMGLLFFFFRRKSHGKEET
ncbi:unnamed protein product [Ophioblennius macclurei]